MAGKVVETTIKLLKSDGPRILGGQYWETNMGKDGAGKPNPPGFLPRLQRAAGPHKSGSDPHIAGRALDIFLFAAVPHEKKLGDDLVQAFLSVKEKLKFISICYNFWEWNGAGFKFGKNNSPHTTHIHIEWGAGNMDLTGFEDDLRDALQQAFTAPAPFPAWLPGWWNVYDGNTYYYYFSDQNMVTYRKEAPASTAVAPASKPLNEGDVTVSADTLEVVLDWNPADGGATKETFTRKPGIEDRMNGVSSRYSPLVATKMK